MKNFVGDRKAERFIGLEHNVLNGKVKLNLYRKGGFKMGSIDLTECFDELIDKLVDLRELKQDIISLALGNYVDCDGNRCNTLAYWCKT